MLPRWKNTHVAIEVAKAGTVVADKTGDLLRYKNTVKRQMLFYGVVNLYRNGLEEFMNV